MNNEKVNLGTVNSNMSLFEDPLLKGKQSQALLGNISPATLYRLVAKGDLPQPIKIGKNSFWRQSWLETYVAQRELESRR